MVKVTGTVRSPLSDRNDYHSSRDHASLASRSRTAVGPHHVNILPHLTASATSAGVHRQPTDGADQGIAGAGISGAVGQRRSLQFLTPRLGTVLLPPQG